VARHAHIDGAPQRAAATTATIDPATPRPAHPVADAAPPHRAGVAAPVADALGPLLRSAVRGRVAAAGPAVLQRRIGIPLDAYASGRALAKNALNNQDLGEYFNMAVRDDLAFVRANATKYENFDKIAEWQDLQDTLRSQTATRPQRVDAIDALVTSINDYFDSHFAVGKDHRLQTLTYAQPTNLETRYAQDPKDTWKTHKTSDYAHATGGPAWRDDTDMWKQFATGLAPLLATLPTVNPRGLLSESDAGIRKEARRPVIQLTWAQAKLLLPRPLQNLIFDVRYQLETAGAAVIDERTTEERTSKKATSNFPGTLRSWHTDSPELLPPNNIDPLAVPASATALHTHYGATSVSGAGSSQKGVAITAPTGYAEYTGTGSNYEHNTKVVLDYINKKVYLTLTHYQYWALIRRNDASHDFFSSDTQEFDQAALRLDDKLKADLQLDPPKPGTATALMSPWIEIVMP